ncbi:MAG: hypothetical protein IPK88_16665 [Saprospiraceae bacterium]|nr:hypothetical protein [Candidatus Defluviibacterium haderslevense]
MTNPFTIQPLKKDNLFQKLLKTKSPNNALIELNNLLASKPISAISIGDINRIESEYSLSLSRNYKKELIGIYTNLLKFYLNDSILSDQEKGDLRSIKTLFNLIETDVKDVHLELTADIYRIKLETVLKEDNLTDSKASFLDSIIKNLELPEEISLKITEEIKTKNLTDKWKEITSDDRLSPDEVKEFESLSRNLNITIQMSEASKEATEKMKYLWTLENSEIPKIEVDLNLASKEVCYYTSKVEWYEYRKITKRIDYHGPSLSIPVFKGLKYKVGSISPKSISKDEIKLIDSGQLFVTNSKVIFVGTIGNKSIPLSKLLFIESIDNGVVLNKETGTSPIIKVSGEFEWLTLMLILNRLIKKD